MGKIRIKTNPVIHSSTTKSIAYRIEYRNKVFVYAGDVEYCNEVIDASKNADVLLLECSFPDNIKVEGHLTPSLAGKIAAKANVKTLILTHFYPEVLKTNIKEACNREFKGKIIIAKDKMKIQI